jgi:hypothetical protein
MKDYLYGKLNKEVEERKLKGLSTPGARVVIDDVENTIRVELTPASEMSNTSSNVVENRVIMEYIDSEIKALEARIISYIDNKIV